MKIRRLRLFAAVLLIPALLLAAAYWLADSWLESAGGRRMLENALTSRSGVPVRLLGDFDLMLLPAIGASGTELVVGGADPRSEIARSRDYEISVALKPLFNRRILIESIRLSGGVVYPGRYSVPAGDGPAPAGKEFRVPEITELLLRDFRIVLPGEDNAELRVNELTVREFAENKAAPVRMDLGTLGLIEGRLKWGRAQSALDVDIKWLHESLGVLELGLVISLENSSASLRAVYSSATLDNPVSLDTQIEYLPAGLRIAGLRLESAGQTVTGAGCLLLLDEPVKLQLDLASDAVDLDVFENVSPADGEGGMDFPLDLDIRFRARELKTAGVLIRGAAMSLGDEPDCSSLDAPELD